jgi:hypothetical protein
VFSANDLHKYLSYKEFKIVDDGKNVYYIIGEFDNLKDAVAANQNVKKDGF